MLDALGPDLAMWPEDAAGAAVDLMARSEAAQDLFAARVAGDPSPGDESDLAERVGRIVAGTPDKN